MNIQGRQLSEQNIAWIQELIQLHPDWHRTRLSRELCQAWEWKNAKGELKDMACRTMLLKLDRMGIIELPAPRTVGVGNARKRILPVAHDTTPILEPLRELTPLVFENIGTSAPRVFFHHLLACLLFGSAAWKVAPRDQWIGWTAAVRGMITNNMRFLILPWVRVPHLASHILGRIARRISQDWLEKYGHPVYLLETFVEQERFRGTCYQVANWIRLGQTQGRSRNDTYQTLKVPRKDIYVYPLIPHVHEVLTLGT